jgi:uncharacterized membrane protein YvbJ
MPIGNLLEKLQRQPLKVKKKIMWGSVLFCALSIFLLWLFLAPHETKNKNTSSLNLGEIREGLKERVDKSGLKNVSGEIKEATQEIINSGKEKEIETNEIPRLPIEIE